MWKLHDTANVWHVPECFSSWINAEEMLITCQADHNEHAFNKTGRLTDCNPMTDYIVANYKSKKRDMALHSAQNTHPLYSWMNILYIEQRVRKLPPRSGPAPRTRTSPTSRPVSSWLSSLCLETDRESSLGCLQDQGTRTNVPKSTKDRHHIESRFSFPTNCVATQRRDLKKNILSSS